MNRERIENQPSERKLTIGIALLLMLAGSRIDIALQQADLVPKIAVAEAVNYYDSVEADEPPPGKKWKKSTNGG